MPEHVLRPNDNMALIRDSHYLNAVARLKPGVTLEQAGADMDAVARHIEERYPDDNTGRGVLLTPCARRRSAI
jgi:putative ABC transport system permease protein